MNQERWSAVERYVTELLAPHDEALDAALEESERAGLPAIQVWPPQGKLLGLLAVAIGARKILEFGTLGGYSTIWLARALPKDEELVTLPASPFLARTLQMKSALASCKFAIRSAVRRARPLVVEHLGAGVG